MPRSVWDGPADGEARMVHSSRCEQAILHSDARVAVGWWWWAGGGGFTTTTITPNKQTKAQDLSETHKTYFNNTWQKLNKKNKRQSAAFNLGYFTWGIKMCRLSRKLFKKKQKL